LATSTSTKGSALRRRYKNPPITEAVCEFQFRGATAWDWTVPGLIYQEIKQEFPQKRQENAFEINIAPKEGKFEQNIAGSLSRMQFLRQDNSAMVQIGPDLLAINALPPYPGWEEFEKLLRKQFEIYLKVTQPIGYKRIGLRFINRILFPGEGMETTEYFNYYPHLPDTVEQSHGPFSMHVSHFYEERDVLNFNMGNAPQKIEGQVGIVLDLDYYLIKPEKIDLGQGLAWVNTAHDRIEAMFEACITDKTRSLFGETK
jgi:uncharacterized protein (TIGR04255 family)